MKIMTCLFIFSIAAMLFCIGSAASDLIRINTIEITPFGYFTKEKISAGLLYDISNRIVEDTGYPYKNDIVPFARMIKNLEDGDADFSIFFRSKKNDRVIIPFFRLLPFQNVVYAVRGFKLKSLEDLHGKIVARVRGARYDEQFNADDRIKKYDTKNYHQSLKMLFYSRLDAVIGPKIGLLFSVKELGYTEKDLSDPLILNTKYTWFQLSKKFNDEKKIDAIRSSLKKLSGNGGFNNTLKIYQEMLNND